MQLLLQQMILTHSINLNFEIMKKQIEEEPVSGGVSNAPVKVHKHKELFWIIPTIVLIAVILALLFI